MKTILYLLSMVVVGVATGIFAFNALMENAVFGTGVKNGPWVTNTAYGDKDAPALLKAGVAKRGLFALTKSETIYFTAEKDSAGNLLRDTCTYRVTGTAPNTRWWSFTLYGEDNYLIDNPENIYSVFMDPVSQEVDFSISPTQPTTDTDWLPSAGGGKLSVTLRLYNPAPAVYEALETTPLPIINQENCS